MSGGKGRGGGVYRHSLILTDDKCFLEQAGRLINSVSEAALAPGFLSGLLGENGGEFAGGTGIEALSLASRTEWDRGRLSRSLIFEVTQRIRGDETGAEEEDGDASAASGELQHHDEGESAAGVRIVGELLAEVLEAVDPDSGGGDEDLSVGDMLAEAVDSVVEAVKNVDVCCSEEERDAAVRKMLASYVPAPLLAIREVEEVRQIIFSYLWTYDLYGPVRNAFNKGNSITRACGKGVGPWKSRLFCAL
jgi:hypothetical protein